MADRASIPSDVVGDLKPLCPNDIAPDCFANVSDSVLDADQDTVPDVTTESKQRPTDSDITGSTMLDTIHYLSPVSPLSPRSVYEGDVDYLKLIEPKPKYLPISISSISSSTISCVEPHLQRTIAIVKPEAMVYQDVVLRAITNAGFSYIARRVIHFTPEEVSEFFCQYYGSPAFPHQVVSMSVGPVLVLSLADACAISKWKNMIGPDKMIREEWFYPMSMRVRFGLLEALIDSLHGSENLTDAYRESRYVYPRHTLEPILEELVKVTDFCSMYVNPTLLDGLVQLVKHKPVDPILFLADWLLLNNPYQPKFDKDIGLLPT
ncbi:nucleoside diphosphate kinase homolog 5-like [Onthophagus taurus]|uniref:nucleoside diphosphate kinase homolog 5-like n=1 Tax=Onthophagus taurus TaxID=166361 RepID=UPI000C2058A1|nr:nucleoside diphosphate kinase homolog 5-like [Onthophagus taurus]